MTPFQAVFRGDVAIVWQILARFFIESKGKFSFFASQGFTCQAPYDSISGASARRFIEVERVRG